MEQINNIELNDENIYPDNDILEKLLGNSFGAYKELLNLFEKNEMSYDWRYYKDGKAWLCKVQKKKRTIIWMSAWKDYMKATIYIPVSKMDKFQRIDLPEEIKKMINDTKNVGKSKPCMFEIRNSSVIESFSKVMEYKIMNA